MNRGQPLEKNVDPVKRVNQWITQALRMGASDIHVEPREHKLVVRIRVDGDLQLLDELAPETSAPLIARLKIMSSIDINERRKPQDGRIRFDDFNQRVKGLDLRVSVNPTLFGEKIVLRLIDNTKLSYTLEDMGFSPYNLERYRACINRPHGLVLHVGPTGSGKTTTLYAALQEITSPKLNLNTVEDPIEYTRDGICQTQVNHEIGLSFPVILRALLRQDPDVIMVGEIRDTETAEIALEAAMTGHLILSTLHTNDAVGTIARLGDMGIPSFYIAYALLCVVSQRFVRKLCVCKVPDRLPPQLEAVLPQVARASLSRAQGCHRCNQAGYHGRVAVMEVLTVDESLQRGIHRDAPTHELKALATKAGMRSLLDDGLEKAAAGLTSVAEVLRVTKGVEEEDLDPTKISRALVEDSGADAAAAEPDPAPRAESSLPPPRPAPTARRVVVRAPPPSQRPRGPGPQPPDGGH